MADTATRDGLEGEVAEQAIAGAWNVDDDLLMRLQLRTNMYRWLAASSGQARIASASRQLPLAGLGNTPLYCPDVLSRATGVPVSL
jgi:hypothetical protein